MTKIKILQDTPFDLKGVELSISDFRTKYGYICTHQVSDKDLVDYIKSYKSHPTLSQTKNYCISDWFEVVEDKPKFVIGDWVWNSVEKYAYLVVGTPVDVFLPNEVSNSTVNLFTEFKRKATQEEINNSFLYPFNNEFILVGKDRIFYKGNEGWSRVNVSDVRYILKEHYNKLNHVIGFISTSYKSATASISVRSSMGLVVGCQIISPEDCIKIKNILDT